MDLQASHKAEKKKFPESKLELSKASERVKKEGKSSEKSVEENSKFERGKSAVRTLKKGNVKLSVRRMKRPKSKKHKRRGQKPSKSKKKREKSKAENEAEKLKSEKPTDVYRMMDEFEQKTGRKRVTANLGNLDDFPTELQDSLDEFDFDLPRLKAKKSNLPPSERSTR